MKRKRCCEHCQAPNCFSAVPTAKANDFKISIPGVVVTTSKSQEGKSHLLNYIIARYGDEIGYGMAISATGAEPHNLPFLDKEYVHTTWPGINNSTKKALVAMVEEQLKIPYDIRPVAGLFIEDEYRCLLDPLISEIVSRPTHYKIFVFIAVNWINKPLPLIREGAWQVALFKIHSKDGLKAAHEAYGQDCESFEDFQKMMKNGTGDFKFMFKNTKASGEAGKWQSLRCPGDIPIHKIGPSPANPKEEPKVKKSRLL